VSGSRSGLRLLAALAAALLPCAPARGAEPQPFPCSVDRLEGALVPGGFVTVRGWAADLSHGTPVAKIEIVLDGRQEGESALSGLRPDVLHHFARADFLWAGWTGTVSLEDVAPGKHSLRVTAVSRTGKRAECGTHPFQVVALAEPPEVPELRIALDILVRSALFLGWLTLVGWGVARLSRREGAAARAPILGLAIFAAVAEGASALGLRPLVAAAALTAAALLFLPISYRIRRPPRRWRPRWKPALLALALLAAFAAIAVAPFAAHGEGAVLGDIDDAIRESALADAINLYGWDIPGSGRGYLASMGGQMLGTGGRRGGSYLLSALAGAFDDRAHAVYSVTMLSVGILAILATIPLAARLLRRRPILRWLPPALVAGNSVLLATMYGQHLGNLLSIALFLAFLDESLSLIRSRRWQSLVPVAILTAGAWTLYTETFPLWAAAAAASLLVAGRRRWKRTVLRYALAVALSAALNPVASARTVRFWTTLDDLPGMRSTYNRTIAGDTHYFPSWNVVSGLEAYREDLRPPVGRVRALFIPLANVLILGVFLAGWSRLPRGRRAIVFWLLAPVSLALLANYRLSFPYGYAKFLPLAVPVWSIALVLLACGAMGSRRQEARGTASAALAAATLVLVLILSLPSARHVHRRALRTVPPFDPAFRVLPALAGSVGRDAVILVEGQDGAPQAWLLYFLGENAVLPLPLQARHPGLRYFVLEDRREGGERRLSRGRPDSRYYALRPLESARAAS
jgi:hypothetical protein